MSAIPSGAPPPANWPVGIPFPPPPGYALPPLIGRPWTATELARWHQNQIIMLGLSQQNALQAQQRLAGGSPTWRGGNSTFNTTASVTAGAFGFKNNSGCLTVDTKQPDTLGWREWRWSAADKALISPSQNTLWPEAELVVPSWDNGEAVRGASGIHAHLVPKHWKIVGCNGGYVAQGDPDRVHGIVERFGKYVLGTEGWRAEWVIIKELMAPSTEVGLELEQAYPDVIIHYPDEEEDLSCTSVKSSKWGKGSRPTSRPKPSPSPSPNSSPASRPLTQTAGNQFHQILQMSLQSVGSSPPTSSQGVPSPPNPSKRESSRTVNRFIVKWFWVLIGVGFYALTTIANR